MSQNIGTVETAARETGQAAIQISQSASDLSRQADVLKQQVGRFLDQIRSDKDKMCLVSWDDALTCGSAEIDDHHRHMFDEINGLYGRMMYGEGADSAPEIVARLGRSLNSHFEEEEGLMGRIGYPAAARHRDQHRQFLASFGQLTRRVEAKEAGAVTDLFEACATWLKEHILRDDRAVAQFLSDRRAA